MVNKMLGIIIAIVSGALMSIQGVFNTNFTKQTNVWFANSFIQLSAFLMCLIIWFATKSSGSIAMLQNVKDKYILLGGVIGTFITFTVIKSMTDLGPAKAVMIIVISQILVAYLIEVFGLFGVEKGIFEIKKFIGIVLAIVGIVIFKW